MKSDWRVTSIGLAALVAAIVLALSWADRVRVLAEAHQDVAKLTSIISAHAGAAIGEAQQVAAALFPEIERWDLEDEEVGREIHERLQRLVVATPRIAASWVLDRNGTNRLDTWSYPSEPVYSGDREYFRRHLEGATNPVISGSEKGRLSRIERFTYSVAARDGSGGLRAVLAVGVHTSGFRTLYREIANESGEAAGLFTYDGGVLATSADEGAAEPGLEILARIEIGPPGSAGTSWVSIGQQDYVVAWRVSSEFPGIVALTSQSPDAALLGWWRRTEMLALLGAGLTILATLLARSAARTRDAREEAALLEIASREVHHRMKNSLQMISSFVRLRSRGAESAETRNELLLISTQLRALSDIQELLEVSATPGKIDVVRVIRRLILRISESHGVHPEAELTGSCVVESAVAGRIAIIVNELVTNALKHGNGTVRVTTSAGDNGLDISVANGGAELPDDFDLTSQNGFGLKSSRAIAESIGGTLTASNGGALGGTVFRLVLQPDDAAQAQEEPAAA